MPHARDATVRVLILAPALDVADRVGGIAEHVRLAAPSRSS